MDTAVTAAGNVAVALRIMPLLLQTLLDLGSSANYKDERGWTPLYHAVTTSSLAGPQCVQMLLYNRSDIGVVDDASNTELHQVRRPPRARASSLEPAFL